MKKLVLIMLSALLMPCLGRASWNAECRYIAETERAETSVPDKTQVKIQFLRRTFKTWLAGESTCKEPIGKTFSAIIPSNDDNLSNLISASSSEILLFRICPEPMDVPCFWDWNSYELTEQ